MRWLDAPERDFARGDGPIVILGDKSDSVPNTTQMAISVAVEDLRRGNPRIRAFAFWADIAEVEPGRDLFGTWPSSGQRRSGRCQSSTDIGHALARISGLRPAKVILFSDGGCRDPQRTIKVADAMTGAIDCFWCEPSRELFGDIERYATGRSSEEMYRIYTADVNEPLMRRIARRGRYVRFNPHRMDLRRELEISIRTPKKGPTMSHDPRHPSIPPGARFIGYGPDGSPHYEIVEEVHFWHRRKTHRHDVDENYRHHHTTEEVHHHPPQIEHRGQGYPQQQPPAITSRHSAPPQGSAIGRLFRRMVEPPQAPQLEPPSRQAPQQQVQPPSRHEIDRGAIRSVDAPSVRRVTYLSPPRKNGGR